MSFPRTPVLDRFQRINEGPPPSVAWRGSMGNVENGGLAVVDERCVGVNRLEINSAFWATAWEADSEAYLTLTDLPDSPYDYSHLRLWVRMAQREYPLFPGQILPVGYFLSYTHHYDAVPCALALRGRYFDETGNYTDAVLWADHAVAPLTVGAGLGVRVTGETLRAFVRLPGGQWTQVGVADDSRFSAGGYGGVQMELGIWGFTDFGGGNYSPGSDGGLHLAPRSFRLRVKDV